MKNTLLSLIVYFCIGISATLAQNTNEDFGYTGGDRSKTLLNGNVIRTSNGSLAADTTKKLTLNGNVVNITSGFAFPVSYFPQVFGKPLFASKGYFAEYVELRWQILAAGNRINQFRIFRKPLGASQDSTLIGTVDANGRSFRDEFAEKGVIYKYTVFAAGIADGTVQPLINTIDAVGFSLATGTATGQITYEGGTAVPNVEVVAETNGDLRGKSLFLNGTNAFLSVADGNELLFHDGFSLQLWTRAIGNAKGVIFSKGEEYQLTYDPTINELTFKLGDELLTMPFEAPQDTFFHIAITYEPSDSLALYTLINDTLIDSVKIKPSNTPEYTDANLFFGKDSLGTTFYKGYMDEIRFWDKQLSFAEILSTFSRNLNGTEADLSGYWRLNAGVGEGFYDISRQGFDFNEHHGLHENGVWSAITPTASQLGFKGITDEAGNYAIVGFPYETSGSLYSFTPILGVHQFNPAQRTFFVGDGNAIINNVDFTDISSFSVTGNVRYSNTPDFGVEGVIILVDGQPVVGSDGQLSMTDHNGQFEVDVPIGNHFITLQKQGHTFEQAGRFPPATTDNAEPTFDFQEPLTGLTFWDTTLVKVAGRVVGGPVEAAYPLGFGLSTDNIGDATIVMTTQKGRDLTSITKSINLEERTINSTMSFDAINPRDITLTADPETGEYIAYLLPEKYTVKSVNASSNSFDPNSFSVVDLTSNIANEEILLDTVGILVNDHFLPEPVFNPADTLNRDEIIYPQFQDTTWIIAMDTFRFQHREDFIYRVTPTIDVTNTEGEEVFGERTFTYVDPNDDSSTQVDLITGTNYNFGHPIFRQLADYQMKIALSEQYTNTDGGSSVVDKVPVTDGQIEIRNDLAINTNLQTFNLDNQGELLYTFTGGTPEVNADPIDTQNSYTRTLGITAISGNNGAIKTVWRPSDPFRGIIFGAKPSGNNFTTLGPINVIAILRDPPGSNSYSFFDKSTSISSTTSVSTSEVEVTNNEAEVSLGFNLTSFVGLGAGVITKLEATEALEVGASVTRENSVDNTVTTTITTDQTWQTSDDKEFVGHRADVFVGTASNLIYGEATNLQIIPTTNCLTTSDCQQQNNGFSIGKLAGVSVADQITTSFTFTVNQIETQIIPGLEKLRNQLLEIGVDTSIVATDKVRYLSLLADTDPHFGSNNHDENIWGDQAKTGGVGPSYALKIPQTIIDTLVGPLTDSVFYYNTQIAGWHYWLRENERRKVQASLEENLSFDAGTSISKSFTVDTVKSTTRTHEWYYDSSIGRRTSAKINSVGLLAKITYTDQESEVDVDINDTTNVTTYGYVLEDGEGAPLAGGTVADFFTIDVKNPGDNFGPSFNLRGGVTSCPYEGEFRTQYFEPGQHVLSSATVRAENPEISVDNAVAANIPSNRQATFTLNLANNSEIGETNWYRLRVDDTTNPNGAILTMDGEFLTDGRSFLIPAGAITQKTLRVAQGQPDVMEYENIRLIFESLCDFSLEDSVEISVFFVPGCSDVNIDLPADNWVVNTNNQPEDRLNVAVNQYDLSHNNFKKALFQYKSTGSSLWITDQVFFNQNFVDQAEFDAESGAKAWIQDVENGGAISFNFDMSSLPDRTYDIRAMTVCELSPGVEVTTPTDAVSGIKDTKRPQLFGSPQPANGILIAENEIAVKFDETIAAGLLTPFNFSIQGVLNGFELRHNVSLDLDGTNDYASIPAGLRLEDRSFTIEFWLKRNALGEQIVFSKGDLADDLIEIGFTASDQFYVTLGSNTFTTTSALTETGWMHIAVVYDHATQLLQAYKNSEVGNDFLLEDQAITNSFTGIGPINIGRSILNQNQYLHGNLHDLRIWNRIRQRGDIIANNLIALSGDEIGLVGCWSFDEAFGNTARDKARFRTATLFADWEVLPKGSAFAFDGVDDYLELNTANTVIVSDETDFSIEFWFKGGPQTNATLFSSGKGDGTDQGNEGSWSIGFNAQEQLTMYAAGQSLVLDGENDRFVDDNWYHFALSVNRLGNVNVFIDGELRKSESIQGLPPLFGNNMWLGARGFKVGATATDQDQFFTGELDEFRIWQFALKQAQILLTRNAKLVGDEIGLLAYYPFETFEEVAGIPVRTTTLADQWQNSQGANGGTAIAFGGADFTDQTPNIVDARPITQVDFDFAVNDDEIIITPAANQAAAIEKAILEISVERVEDLYENRIASPITWTAFVDRNQLVWGEDQVAFEKEIDDSFQFSVEIINRGGTPENFTIENLPLWLTASPQSGTLDPQATQTITFTVNEGLNTGNYQEDLFLSSDFGFDEKLTLSLRVFEPLPDAWEVDPTQFQFSMNIIAQVKIDGRISNDPNDVVVVFVNGEARGRINLEYVPAYDNYQAFLTIYSNSQSGEVLDIKVWDDSKGQVFTDITPTYTFSSNANFGQPANPQVLETGSEIEEKLEIPSGWKWVSFNLSTPDLSDVNLILSELSPQDGDLIKGRLHFDQYSAADGTWLGTITNNGGLQNEQMYRLHMGNAGTIVYEGTPAVPAMTPITIKRGWNWIGFVSNQNLAVNEALSGFNATDGDIIKSQYLLAVYDANFGWIGNLDFLIPGEGYMLNAQNAGTLVYPESSAINGRTMTSSNDLTHFELGNIKLDPHAYRYQMTAITQLVNYPHTNVKPNTRLLALADGNVQGIARPKHNPITNQYDYFLVLYTNEPNTRFEFKLTDDTGEVLSDIQETLDFKINDVQGELDAPLKLHLNQTIIHENAFEVFPNPVHDQATLRLQLMEKAEVKVEIIDAVGKQVAIIPANALSAGIHEFEWDTQQVTSGVYYVRATLNGETFMHRLMILK